MYVSVSIKPGDPDKTRIDRNDSWWIRRTGNGEPEYPSYSFYRVYLEANFRPSFTKTTPVQISGTSTVWRPPTYYVRGISQTLINAEVEWVQPQPASNVHWKERRWNSGCQHTATGYYVSNWWAGGLVVTDENQLTRAETECLLKIGNKKLDLGVSLAEAKRTANMLAESSTLLVRALLLAKRGQWRQIPRVFGITQKKTGANSPSDWYLQYRYGWMPLLKDIKGLHDLLKEQLKPALLIHARRNLSDDYRIDLNKVSVVQGDGLTCSEKVRGKIWRRHNVALTGRITDQYLRTASQTGSLPNPALIGWEIIPYSFVVDWFIPVGKTLEALSATAGLDFIGGYNSVSGELYYSIEQTPTGGWTGSPRLAEGRVVSVKRVPYANWPKPGVYTVSPFRTSNVLAAVALIAQLNKK